MLKTPANPGGTPMAAFDKLRAAAQTAPSSGRISACPSTRVQPAGREDFRRRTRVLLAPGHDGRASGVVLLHQAFSETDLAEDLKKIDVPTLILHGDDDQIVPIADSPLLSAKIVKRATLKVYAGAPHGCARRSGTR